MIYWNKYLGHTADIHGKKNKFDNTVYSFDIETTSYMILNNKMLKVENYLDLDKKSQEDCTFKSTMYIWMFSIDKQVYYGRTWNELKAFLGVLFLNVPERKIVFVHNLSYEFQFLRNCLKFDSVLARKKRKVMKAICEEFNLEFRCSLMMTNVKLEKLPKIYQLPVEKQVGKLDYSKIRHSFTQLTEYEMSYCEYDCLVIYYYILKELEVYKTVDKIPLTSTGHVRRELKGIVLKDWKYKNKVKKAINTNPHIYNMLVKAFIGGYTHANWIFVDEIIKNVDSFDETSAYPYVLVTHRYPSTEFKKCNLKDVKYMMKNFAYLITIRMNKVKSKYYNTFISKSACTEISKGKYDNGRIIECDYLTITCTDVDLKLYFEAYNIESYEIIESYYSLYDYLPKQFIEFVLEKYVNKTMYKDVEGKELEYALEKGKFNSLYGMSVTNNISDKVIFDNDKGWYTEELTNDEIIEKLDEEKNQSFLSFAYGVWVTAWARHNLLKNVMKLDEYIVYCDTDSAKLRQGYNKEVFEEYNKFVYSKIKHVSELLEIPIEKFMPKDSKGKEHCLGVFESETLEGEEFTYQELITQGAKKYAVKQKGEIKITVAGVPKSGAKALKDLKDFKDDFVFDFKDTGKNLLIYNEDMTPFVLEDYEGNEMMITDRFGCCLLPTTYVLGKALEFATLLNDFSEKRSIYKE